MPNKILNTILTRKIENFVSTFVDDSKSIFYNENQLIHPGEFGKYRENALKDLIRTLINPNFKIGDGFIITSNDKISTQCDVVIYDNTDTTILENNYSQFFTIESVLSIGEIKSTLNKTGLKEALIKLANNKQLADDISKTLIKKTTKEGEEFNLPISFLICKNLDFDISKIDFDDVYKDINRDYWHNFILSIEDGLFTYIFHFEKLKENIKKKIIKANGDLGIGVYTGSSKRTIANTQYDCDIELIKLNETKKFEHISIFISLILQMIDKKTLYETDLVSYVDVPKVNIFK